MAFIPVPNTAKVTWVATLFGQQVEFGLYFKKSTGAVSDADLQALAEAGSDWWNTTGKANHTSEMSHIRTKATNYNSEGAPEFIDTPASPVAGTQGSFLANNAAFVLTQRTAKRGRKYRGRAYLPGIGPSGAFSGVALADAQIADILADWATMITALEAAPTIPFDAVVVSRATNGVPLTTATTEPIIVATADTNIDSQRRRLRGRGI